MCLLIKYNGDDINELDGNGISPLMTILERNDLTHDQQEKLINLFLKAEYMNLDAHQGARRRIWEQFPEFRLKQLQCDLRNKSESQFKEDFVTHVTMLQNQPNVLKKHKTILLIDALHYGLARAVTIIVHSGLCIDWKELEENFTTGDPTTNPLIYLINSDEFCSESAEFTDYENFFSLICEGAPKLINVTDRFGKSPLHHALLKKNRKAALKLLEEGVYLGVKAKNGDLAMHYMSAKFLKDFLDSLMTSERESDDSIMCFDSKNFFDGDVQNAMPIIEHIRTSQELSHLLKHPVIKFILDKWCKQTYGFNVADIILLCVQIALLLIPWYCFPRNPNDSQKVTLFFMKALSLIMTVLVVARRAFKWIYSFRQCVSCKSSQKWVEIFFLIFSFYLLCLFKFTTETEIHYYIVQYGTAILLFMYDFLVLPSDFCLLITLKFRTGLSIFFKNFFCLSPFLGSCLLIYAPLSKDGEEKSQNLSHALLKVVEMLTSQFSLSESLKDYILAAFALLVVATLTVFCVNFLINSTFYEMEAISSEVDTKVQMRKVGSVAEWALLFKKILCKLFKSARKPLLDTRMSAVKTQN